MSHRPFVLQSVDRFVGRTQNWLYDHLRFLPSAEQIVCARHIENRVEFPELTTWNRQYLTLQQRVWRKLTGQSISPTDRIRLTWMRPTILHSHFGYIAMADTDLNRALNVPWVVSFYGADAFQGSAERSRNAYGRLFEDADTVLALGPFMKQRLEQLGSQPSKTIVHPLGIDSSQVRINIRKRKPDEPLRLLFAGTLREKKGVPYVIEAAGELRRRGVPLRLTVIGDAGGKSGDLEIKEEVAQKISKLGLEDDVECRSFVTFPELMDIASRCHVFVAPSVTAADGDSEGTPFVLQQMMASGMPSISTMHSDIPFIFGSQQDLLLPERDSVAIADRAQQYFEQPELLEIHGRALRTVIEEKDVRVCAARLAESYRRISV